MVEPHDISFAILFISPTLDYLKTSYYSYDDDDSLATAVMVQLRMMSCPARHHDLQPGTLQRLRNHARRLSWRPDRDSERFNGKTGQNPLHLVRYLHHVDHYIPQSEPLALTVTEPYHRRWMAFSMTESTPRPVKGRDSYADMARP